MNEEMKNEIKYRIALMMVIVCIPLVLLFLLLGTARTNQVVFLLTGEIVE